MEEVAVLPPDVPKPKGRPRGYKPKKKIVSSWPFKRDPGSLLFTSQDDYDRWTEDLMNKHKAFTETRERLLKDFFGERIV